MFAKSARYIHVRGCSRQITHYEQGWPFRRLCYLA